MLAVIFVASFVWQFATAPADTIRHLAGIDLRIYASAASRWMSGGAFYLDHQLAGPYLVTEGDVLYPPVWLLVFAPASLLPWPVWWVVPVGITIVISASWRPSPWGVTIIAACLAWPPTASLLLTGNPDLWLTAALALATRHRWAAVVVLTKITVSPLALVGVRNRGWWLGLAVLALVSLIFLPMWSSYVVVLLNARSSAGVFYSAQDLPLLMIPLVAWTTSLRRAGSKWRLTRPPRDPAIGAGAG